VIHGALVHPANSLAGFGAHPFNCALGLEIRVVGRFADLFLGSSLAGKDTDACPGPAGAMLYQPFAGTTEKVF
jgi:hypothetical protein